MQFFLVFSSPMCVCMQIQHFHTNYSNFQLLMISEDSSQKQMTYKVEQTDLEKCSREMAEGMDSILKHTKLAGVLRENYIDTTIHSQKLVSDRSWQ